MTEVELTPDLSNCIEAVARKHYQQVVQGPMSSGEMSDEVKAKMEILRLFLEGADFRKLRAESEPHLLQGKKVTFVISAEHGMAKYEMHIRSPR